MSPALSAFRDALLTEPRLLDAGCGPGTVTARLPGAPVALDASAEQLRLAREITPEARLVQGNLARLPVAAETIDGVVVFWSLIHAPETTEAVRESARVLALDGHAGRNDRVGEVESGLARRRRGDVVVDGRTRVGS